MSARRVLRGGYLLPARRVARVTGPKVLATVLTGAAVAALVVAIL